MFAHMSLKMKLILSTIALVLISGIVIGGLSLQQFSAFSDDALHETYSGLETQGLLLMQTGVDANLQKIERLIETAHDTVQRLSASSNMREYLNVAQDAEYMAQREANRIVLGLLDTFRIQSAQLQRKVDESLTVAEYVIQQHGQFKSAGTGNVEWEALNQLTQETHIVRLPQMMLGETPIEKNTTFERMTPVVDDVHHMVNTTCTIFQRMNIQGDMLRIATNVKQTDGSRAVGTYIPATNPDGTPNPVISTVLQGDTYRGRAYVVNAWYITAYKPLFDEHGRVIGVLYVGVPQENPMLTDTILNTKIGTAGYSFVMDVRGTILIHPQAELVGKHVIDDLGVQEFREAFTHLSIGVVKTIIYAFEGQMQFVSYVYFPDWDWILCVGYSREEMTLRAVQRAHEALVNEIVTTYQTSTVFFDEQNHPMFNQIRYIDARGQEVFVLQYGKFVEGGASKVDTEWFRESVTLALGEVYCSGVEVAANTQTSEMRVLSAVYDNEEFRGIVVVNLDWDLAWNLLKDQVYGDTGYAYILNDEGILISHPKYRLQDQMNLSDSGYGELARLVKEEMLPGQTGTGRYAFEGIDYFVAFAPLKMLNRQYVLAVTTPEEEFFTVANDIARRMEQRYRSTVGIVVGVIVLGMFCAFGLVIIISRSITHPVHTVMAFAQNVSDGDLSKTLPVTQRNEIGILLKLINRIVETLRQFIQQIQRSAIQVTSSATELSATAQQQKTTVAVQVKSIDEVGHSVKEISDVTRNLAHIMREVAAMSQETANFASSGQADLTRMEETMRRMEQASKSISSKLEIINEKAGNITTVVTTINKVADQTNLLSLNASIEAEKAGEYGRGFTVVAREIRRLADQTAIATLDIDRMVKEMQSAVSSGVMEMDKFIAEVRQSVADVAHISEQLARIIEQVQVLSPRFEDVNLSMEQQSDHAQSITAAMMHLNDEMQETSDSLNESFTAIEQLNEAVHILKNEVSRFKVE